MRAAAVLTGCLSVAACNFLDRHSELAACEDYAKASLRSPATYSRAKARISDERMPRAYWQARERNLFGSDSAFSGLYKKYSEEGGIRTVVLEYDAANAYGTPVRGIAACKFELQSIAEEKFTTEPDAASSKLDLLTVQAGVQPDGDDLGCCMSRTDLRLISRFAKDAEFVNQKVVD